MQYPNIAQPQYGFAPTMPMMAAGGKVQAENVRAQGRNNDSMLVHMTPNEVAGLQALAMQHGGSLTINPQTGLPEAGFLENILPTLLGVGLSFIPGVGPMMAAGLVGGGTALATGDISKGLMAGLGAFGGANLGAGLTAAGAQGAQQTAMANVAAEQASNQAALANLGTDTGVTGFLPGSESGVQQIMNAYTQNVPSTFAEKAAAAGEGIKGLGTEAGREALLGNVGGYSGLAKQAGMAIAPTLVPEPYKPPKPEKSTYEGPYTPTPREVRFPTAEDKARIGTSEFQYFTDVNPVPGFQPFSATKSAQSTQSGLPSTANTLAMLSDEEKRRMMNATASLGFGMRKGGSVPQLENGGFVLTKRAVDGLGRGSNKKGQQVASRGLGAIPIKGPGTGTSDSIPTTIDGKYPARISNGEAYVPKDKVKKHGGAKKFYALMKKAERAAA